MAAQTFEAKNYSKLQRVPPPLSGRETASYANKLGKMQAWKREDQIITVCALFHNCSEPNDCVCSEPSSRIKMSHSSVSNPGNCFRALADQHKPRFICCITARKTRSPPALYPLVLGEQPTQKAPVRAFSQASQQE